MVCLPKCRFIRQNTTRKLPICPTRSCGAAGLSTDDLRESADIPQFLAIVREVAERRTGLRPFDAVAWRVACRRRSRWPPVRAKPSLGRSRLPVARWAGRHVHVRRFNDTFRPAAMCGVDGPAVGRDGPMPGSPRIRPLTSAGPAMTVMSPAPRSTRLASMYCAISW